MQAEETHPATGLRLSPRRPPGSLHAQVPGGRRLTRAAGDRRHGQAAEEQVHGGQEGLEEADGAEGRASVWGEVDFVGVGAGRLQERLVLTARPGWRDGERRPNTVNPEGRTGGGGAGLPQRIKETCITRRLGWSYCKCCHTSQKKKKAQALGATCGVMCLLS